MEGSDGSPPSSLWMIRAAELFPKLSMEKEDEQLTIPFQELTGESVKYLGRTDDGVLALSNYRLFLLKSSTNSETSVPLGLIESAQIRDLFHLMIYCKDASTVKCSFESTEQCTEWQRRIMLSIGVPETLESLFAFPFYSWSSDTTVGGGSGGSGGGIENSEWSGRLQRSARYEDDFRKEVERLQFDLSGTWRISSANADFKLCPSYPQLILVPCCISDETLQNVANFRSSRRLPAVVWRHKLSGAVIARSSQPEVGWLGWRNSKDEQLLKALADACAFDRGEQNRRQNLSTSGESTPSSTEGSHEEVNLDEVRKILIVDARSYTSAVTNRARGGGCECIEYYPCAEIEFMNLGNIHVVRKSFHSLRQLCASPPDVPNWLGLLERTMWLQHLSGLLAASMTVCHAIEKKGRPVLVHCSDGWDRTPQIVATAELCLDPYYRTVEGFRILVEREWLNFGHKFADRCGHGPGSDDLNERCPVFLQWLDLVHQIHRQFPCSFEFSMAYLIKLAQHSHSCLFGTFLCNTSKERIENTVLERTFSVWPFLSGPMYRNPLYVPNKEKVLWPAHNVRDLALWSEVYLGSLGNQNPADFPHMTDVNPESTSPMTKTRSYGDLITVGNMSNGLTRRSSDPNMTVVDSNIIMPSHNSENNSVVDLLSDRETSPDLISNIIHDTTKKLQILTNELNQSDEEICKINKVENFTSQKIINGGESVRDSVNSVDDCDMNPYDDTEYVGVKTVIVNANAVGGANLFNLSTENSSLTRNNNYNNNDDDDDVIKTHMKNDNANNHDDVNCDAVDGSDIKNLYGADIMESIELRDKRSISPIRTSDTENPWHGSINTSTDTLVPIESQNSNNELYCGDQDAHTRGTINQNINDDSQSGSEVNNLEIEQKSYEKTSNTTTATTTTTILPEEHFNKLNSVTATINGLSLGDRDLDESILILPEHKKLEISNNDKCDTMINNNISTTTVTMVPTSTATTTTSGATVMSSAFHKRRRTSSSHSKNEISLKAFSGSTSRFSTPGMRSLPLTPPGLSERPAVALSCPDGLAHALSEQNIRLQQIVYEHKLREDALLRELQGMRMALLKKTCPHCNNQQFSSDEQVDVKINETNYYSANNLRRFDDDTIFFGASPESANSALDNIENLSICSWEAVEDRSGPSSGASSTQPTGSVLWVPDHAVSRCTGCQTEFWLGRRKHHCRSCGQIFCADCSEFWAPLPDERLYNPVRLCGPCYNSVTARIQQQTRNSVNSITNQFQQLATISSSSTVATTTTALTKNLQLTNNCVLSSSSVPAATTVTVASNQIASIENACKHAASPPRNERSPLKATTASN